MTSISLSDNLQISAMLLNQHGAVRAGSPLPTIGRGLTLTLAAGLISFALFQLMAQLVQSTAPITAHTDTVMDVTPLVPRQESTPNRIVRVVPPPPLAQPVPKLALQASEEPGELLAVPLSTPQPELTFAGPGSDTPPAADKAATPLVRIEPRYPPAAARDGVNGWVRLRFNIAADGRVTDVKVLAAEPRRVFEQEAMRALRNWKYQPRLENGRGVAQSDLEVQLDFRLDQQG